MANSNHHEITSFFVDASKALEENPHLKETIAHLQQTIDALKAANEDYNGQITRAGDEIAHLKDQVKEVEQRLDDASFRELEAREKLENILSVFGNVTPKVKEAQEFLNPPPPPMQEVPENPTQADQSQASADHTSTSTGTTEATNVTENPTTSSSGVTSQEGMVSVDSAPSSTANATGNDSPFASSTEGASPPAQPQSESEHTEKTSMALSDGSNSGKDVQTQESASSPSQTKPYATRAYWDKPSGMTWAEWKAGGGSVAPWIREDQL